MDPAPVCITSFQHVVRFQPMQITGEVGCCFLLLIFTMFLMHLFQAALIEFHGIGKDREHDVVFAQFIVLCELNRHCQVGNAGKAKQLQVLNESLGDPFFNQILMPCWLVEETGQVDDHVIVQRDDHIGVFHIVDPGDVFITDALDAMFSKTVFDQGRALPGFTGSDPACREDLL